jgi:oxalate decarboxylase/phosphoglucose isomerase-like protein (cupin superfamily)
MADYEGLVSAPDGAARTVRRKAGDVVWTAGVTHRAENTGKTVSRVMIVELKTPGKA